MWELHLCVHTDHKHPCRKRFWSTGAMLLCSGLVVMMLSRECHRLPFQHLALVKSPELGNKEFLSNDSPQLHLKYSSCQSPKSERWTTLPLASFRFFLSVHRILIRVILYATLLSRIQIFKVSQSSDVTSISSGLPCLVASLHRFIWCVPFFFCWESEPSSSSFCRLNLVLLFWNQTFTYKYIV